MGALIFGAVFIKSMRRSFAKLLEMISDFLQSYHMEIHGGQELVVIVAIEKVMHVNSQKETARGFHSFAELHAFVKDSLLGSSDSMHYLDARIAMMEFRED
jgi:hypothetical protein